MSLMSRLPMRRARCVFGGCWTPVCGGATGTGVVPGTGSSQMPGAGDLRVDVSTAFPLVHVRESADRSFLPRRSMPCQGRGVAMGATLRVCQDRVEGVAS